MSRRLLAVLGACLAACTPDIPTAAPEPAQLTLFKAPPTGTPGWLLDDALEVRVTDPAGRPIAGATVTWRAEADGAQLEAAAPQSGATPNDVLNPLWTMTSATVTDANGVARVRYAPGWASGVQRVVATAGTISSVLSVPVTSFTATAVAAGRDHACGLDPEGRLYCWKPTWRERNLGPIPMPASMRPVAANNSERFIQLTGSEQFQNGELCGLTTDHALRCALMQGFGAGEAVTLVPVTTPAAFVAISGTTVGSLAEQSFLCGLDATGQAWCRGRNDDGQLGDGTTISRNTFAPVSGSVRFTTIATSNSRACGLDLTAGAWCWGSGPAIALGIPTPFGDDTTVPTAVGLGHVYRDIAPITSGACGIRQTTNELECWGYATINRLGLSPTSFGQDAVTPRAVVGTPLVREMSGSAIASGQFLTVDGKIANWGDQVPFDLDVRGTPEFGAGLTGFDRILTRGTGAICSAHSSGSTICSWVYYRGVGVPVP